MNKKIVSMLVALFLALSAVSAVSGDGSDPLDPSDGEREQRVLYLKIKKWR